MIQVIAAITARLYARAMAAVTSSIWPPTLWICLFSPKQLRRKEFALESLLTIADALFDMLIYSLGIALIGLKRLGTDCTSTIHLQNT